MATRQGEKKPAKKAHYKKPIKGSTKKTFEKGSSESRVMEATILFADMVDSSMLSHVHDPSRYDRLVSSFQEMCAGTVEKMLRESEDKERHVEAMVRGDELCMILACSLPGKSQQDFDTRVHQCTWLALQVAIRLKRSWLLVPENKERIWNGQPPLGIAIGIHAGPVVVRPHIRFKQGLGILSSQKSVSAEGYAINTAKRVEAISRLGRFSHIYLTRPIYNRTPADFRQAFVRVDVPDLKGIATAPIIYEAKGIGHFDDKAFPQSPEFDDPENLELYEKIVSNNPDQIWLLLDLAHKYFDIGEYDKAAERYKLVIEADPEFAPAFAYLGRAHFRNYRFAEAHAALENALNLSKDQARANHFFAVCLRREALLILHKENSEPRARDLLQEAIGLHHKAFRTAELEQMDYTWALNGLNWTIAQSCDVRGISVPYGLKQAFESSEHLRSRMAETQGTKEHLILHTLGFIQMQQKEYAAAKRFLKQAQENLNKRKGEQTDAPDLKGYAERKAEILYHLGLCEYRSRGQDGLKTAVGKWKEALQTIQDAWGTQAKWACEGQYWWYQTIETKSGIGTIGSLASQA